MDYRNNQVLIRLLSGEKIPILQLAETFSVTQRRIRKNIKELNEELEEKNLPIITTSEEGILSFDCSEKTCRRQLQEFILENNFYTYHLSPNERKTITIMILLTAQDYITAAYLSEYLGTSRNTLVSDLNRLKDWFLKNEMILVSQVQKGYIVEASEKQRRNGILKLVELNLNEAAYGHREVFDAFQHFLLNEINYQERFDIIKKVLKEEEIKYDSSLSDYSFMEAVYELLIVVERLSVHKYLKMSEANKNNTSSSKYSLSKAVLARLEEAFHLEVPEQEVLNFVDCLRRKSYLKTSTNNIDYLVVQILIGEVISHISSRFEFNFYLDFSLYDLLVNHMKSVIYRQQYGEVLRNPFLNDMEHSYPHIFQTVEECVKPLEDYLNCKFPKDEISFMVMYFASMLERDKAEKQKMQKVKAAVVCATGQGTVQLMLAKLEQMADVLEIVDVKSVHDAAEMEKNHVQMVISTRAVHDVEISCVQVASPMLTKEDLLKIRTMAMDMKDNREHAKALEQKGEDLLKEELPGRTLYSMLSENRIKLDVQVDSWQQAVREAGKLLYYDKMVSYEYIEAMVDNIYENGSYVVIMPGVAIPHAEKEKGAKIEGVSLVRLKTPVNFQSEKNDPVLYVIGLSILSAKSSNVIIYEICKLFGNEDVWSRFNDISNEKELLHMIKQLEYGIKS